MTPAEIAVKAAEEVMRQIERDKRIIKASIAEAIEKVLLTTQASPTYTLSWAEVRAIERPPPIDPTRLRAAEARRKSDCKKLGIEFIPSAGYAAICGND